jgi:hypothetical protein
MLIQGRSCYDNLAIIGKANVPNFLSVNDNNWQLNKDASKSQSQMKTFLNSKWKNTIV